MTTGPWDRPPPPPRPRTPVLGLMGIAGGAGAFTVAGMGLAWERIGGSPMSIHGWIALTLGVMGAAFLAGGLMALAFHSSRSGHDDRIEDGRDR